MFMANNDTMNYSERSYDELVRELDRLEAEYNSIETQCLKDNMTFDEFCNKAHDVKEKMFFASKYMRIKQEPVITYGKEWTGEKMTFDEFKSQCGTGFLTDDDGVGYYATESSKSDIRVYPSDIEENVFRTDFPYVIWTNK